MVCNEDIDVAWRLLIFCILQVSFINTDGTENLNPSPPFKIKLPRTLKGSNGALPGRAVSTSGVTNDVSMVDANHQKERLIIETYTPPDPGPYPQDQPKQNSVRFTPTQVHSAIQINYILSLLIYNSIFWLLIIMSPISS